MIEFLVNNHVIRINAAHNSFLQDRIKSLKAILSGTYVKINRSQRNLDMIMS